VQLRLAGQSSQLRRYGWQAGKTRREGRPSSLKGKDGRL
jgi:hypothetical protein